MACNQYCCGADKLFDLKGAKKELKKYRKKGPGKPTQKLIDLLLRKEIDSKSLIDIGGGIGAVQWAFLQRGGSKAISIDASGGYLDVAKSYAREIGFENNVTYRKGDFIDHVDAISESDFVSLDKVICCYPDYKSLLEAALSKCKDSIGLVFPVGGPIAKLFAIFEMMYFQMMKIQFGTYIHNPKEVEQFIIGQGFELVEKTTSFPWHIQVYAMISH